MVSSLSYQLPRGKLITAFGMRRRPTRHGHGIVRKTIGALSRPALTFVANKIADAITGGSARRRWTVTRRRTVGSSFKPTGYGLKARKPRKTLGRSRVRRVLF